jgi:hypothetical protein
LISMNEKELRGVGPKGANDLKRAMGDPQYVPVVWIQENILYLLIFLYSVLRLMPRI